MPRDHGQAVPSPDAVAGGPKVPITAMVFTLNEEIHLPSCLESLRWCGEVVVIDSFSTDGTPETAAGLGARVVQHPFEGFGSQRNWALENSEPRYPWVLILDADERVPPELADEIRLVLADVSPATGAFRIRRRFHLWGRWLRHSSLYPTWVVRLVHKDRVRFQNRGHAETQEVRGAIGELKSDLIDENLRGIDSWFTRQNCYAGKEAEYELQIERTRPGTRGLWSPDPLLRRAALKRIVARLPARPALYFIYSYFLRLGFLDGRDGYVFCLMKAIYVGMIVAKKHDMRRRVRRLP